MLDPVGMIFAALGVTALAASVLPRLLGRIPVSMPMVFLAAGFVAFALIGGLPDPDPMAHGGLVLHLTEVCVIISLMGAGLALNRPVGWRRWATTWRLLGITMPLTIIAVAFLGWAMLGLGVAAAVLLAAALAPTDPVLATEVQVGEPADSDNAEDDEARFALTSEAGLNDGLAFPFTYAAIAISVAGAALQLGSPIGCSWTSCGAFWPDCSSAWASGGVLASCSFRSSSTGCGCPNTPKGSWRWPRRSLPTALQNSSKATDSSPSSFAPALSAPRNAATATTASCTASSNRSNGFSRSPSWCFSAEP
ncbi:hypothetical protein M2428_001891 [Arthrobacter sp. ES3-54]|nr:hypothetical protein [Arthrobacter sp. ES3-54]